MKKRVRMESTLMKVWRLIEYVRGVHTAPANESEVNHPEQALDAADVKPSRLYADKGYASAGNRDNLR